MTHELTRISKKAGTLDVLVSLYTEGELGMSGLYRMIHLDRGTISSAVVLLKSLNLVTLRKGELFPYAQTVALTALGRRLIRRPVFEWPSILFENEVGGTRP
jgi:DNA-binding MarR family transcriptional regulator